VCFDLLYNFYLKRFSFYEEFSETVSQVRHLLHVKYPLLLSDFNENCIFSTEFRKMLKHQIPPKSVQWEPSCSTRADGQTDMTEVLVDLRIFAKATKNPTFIETKGKFPSPHPHITGPNAEAYESKQQTHTLGPM
jgi:hypothetical protein